MADTTQRDKKVDRILKAEEELVSAITDAWENDFLQVTFNPQRLATGSELPGISIKQHLKGF